MPRPSMPPTPGASTEITAKDGYYDHRMTFELPPPAMPATERPSSASTKASSESSYRPTSPMSPDVSPKDIHQGAPHRQSGAGQVIAKEEFSLPPPPTRSRKIIQMKPREQAEQETALDSEGAKAGSNKAAPGTQNKKKQPSATSAAGRKIARKTAHSLIERRRRSKMNEEFGVLKSMIPACTGEMHKLAILQASIDYVRYLEDCVAQLKAQNGRRTPTAANQEYMPMLPMAREPYNMTGRRDNSSEDDEDMEMTGSETASPQYASILSGSKQPSVSPALLAQDSRNRTTSISSTLPGLRHYSFSSSNASPPFGPTHYQHPISTSACTSTVPSPALLPQGDQDHEATEALLMLNADRRGTQGSISSASGRGRGMSVKDLLTS